MEKEYIIFCDESEKTGKYYSNFYGGLIVGSSKYEVVTKRLNDKKQELNFFGEIKWEKVTERYLPKYVEMMAAFFEEVIQQNVRARVMFRQNAHQPKGLTDEQIDMEYFILYYQFIKHGFGLEHVVSSEPVRLRLYFDQFPDTKEKVEQFKGYLLGLQLSSSFRKFKGSKIALAKEDITEVRSHDHVLLQCLDIVMGAMTFRLNDKHKEKPPGQRMRGKRTRAKEELYKEILRQIKRVHPRFNIGISTGTETPREKWESPYLHWCFKAKSAQYNGQLTKKGQKKK